MDAATAKALLGITGGIRLVGHKEKRAYEVWVWEAANGQGYVTKREPRRTYGWTLVAPNWTAESFLKNNKIQRVEG